MKMTLCWWQTQKERKLKWLLDKIVNEGKKERQSINYKKAKCIIINKRESSRCEQHLGDVKIKQVQKYNYLGRVQTDDGKFNAENLNDVFQVLKDRKMFQSKKSVLNWYAISNLWYNNAK